MKDGGLKLKKKKLFKTEPPNEEWFWKNREAVWRLHPDMKIEKPKHLKYKEKQDEGKK